MRICGTALKLQYALKFSCALKLLCEPQPDTIQGHQNVSKRRPHNSGDLGRIQGGGPGVQGPPLVPREGVLDPSSKMKKTAFFICFIYYPAIMPQNSSPGTKSQNFLGGLTAPPKPPAAYGLMKSFIQVFIHLWHVEILIVCVLDKITVFFSISLSSKIYLTNSDWSTDWSWWETKTYIFIVWIT